MPFVSWRLYWEAQFSRHSLALQKSSPFFCPSVLWSVVEWWPWNCLRQGRRSCCENLKLNVWSRPFYMTISVETTTAGMCKIGFIQKQTSKILIICDSVNKLQYSKNYKDQMMVLPLVNYWLICLIFHRQYVKGLFGHLQPPKKSALAI